jgi:hypothetical protein
MTTGALRCISSPFGIWYRVEPDESVVVACLAHRQDLSRTATGTAHRTYVRFTVNLGGGVIERSVDDPSMSDWRGQSRNVSRTTANCLVSREIGRGDVRSRRSTREGDWCDGPEAR